MNAIARCLWTNGNPQPPALCVLFPAGLVDPELWLLLHVARDGCIDGRKCGTDARTTGRDASDTDADATHILEQRGGSAHTQMVAAMQQTDQGTPAWAKRSRWQIAG
jgi:hypothetical protein